MARHAAPGLGGFFRELGVFALKVLFWGVVVFGAVLLIPKVFGGSSTTTTATVAATSSLATTSTTATTVAVLTTTAPSTAPTTTAALRNPAQVRVQVLNSTERDGIAAALSEVLAGKGYVMTESANYAEALDTSRVWYSAGFAEEARVLAAEIPDAEVEPAPTALDVDILVVIGASYP